MAYNERPPPKENPESKRLARGRTRSEGMFPAPVPRSQMPADYAQTLAEIKERIKGERLRTVFAANTAMVLLYWDVGQIIRERQKREGWGARVIDRLAADLRESFPDMKGFSPLRGRTGQLCNGSLHNCPGVRISL